MDLYEAPNADGPVSAAGQVDPLSAVSNGLRALAMNALQAFAVAVIGIVVYYLSICTCVGWIASLPLLMYGGYKFVLEAVDGTARIEALWSGLGDAANVFVRMWAVVLLQGVIFLPVLAVVLAIVIVPMAQGEVLDPVTQWAAITVPTSLYGFLVVRVMFAPFAVVDRGLGAVDAFSYAWEVSAGQWGRLAMVQLAILLINAPVQALSLLVQVYAAQMGQNAAEALAGAFTVLGLNLVVMLLSLVTGMLAFAIYASAWRQMAGPSPAPV